ncbi:unnamed protein product [Linum trigynum]|uniref:CCHC-type domain-containing protein n=1 Tax=Linum trigynum TaxID=586398 RepID=A0AAV2E1I8_9ROSI
MEVVSRVVDADQVVEFAVEDVESRMKWVRLSLLGRLFMESPPSLSLIQKIVNGAWECALKVKVLEAEMGLLQFFFGSKSDINRVLQRTPWPVKDHVLHLQPWQPVTHELVDSFIHVSFWVQMWGIPTHCRTSAFGKRMAEAKLGEVVDVGAYAVKGNPNHFIKAKTKINGYEPLCSQLFASNPVVGEFWVRLIYEFLPMYCYHCGRLGHMGKHCKFTAPTRIEHYGPGLSTNIAGHRVEERF